MSTVASFRDITQWLYRIRQPLANYQELKGLPKDEIFGFLSLLTTLCQHSYNAFVVIFAMLYNLSPMVDSILYLLRFLLDKIIDIGESEDMNEKLNKLLIFLGQLLVLSMVMFMISTLLIIPIFNLIGSIFSCTWGWMGLHYV